MNFNWRLVLENPDPFWPAGIIDQAIAMREAERAGVTQRFCTAQTVANTLFGIRNLHTGLVRLLRAAEVDRFFDNRDPRDWAEPVPVVATEWVP